MTLTSIAKRWLAENNHPLAPMLHGPYRSRLTDF